MLASDKALSPVPVQLGVDAGPAGLWSLAFGDTDASGLMTGLCPNKPKMNIIHLTK